MAESAVSWLAALLILISVAKVATLLICPRAWLRLVRRVYARPPVVTAVALSLAGVALAILLASGLGIVQILAVCLFFALMIAPGLAHYTAPLMTWLDEQDIRAMLRQHWAYIGIWLILLAWGVIALALGD